MGKRGGKKLNSVQGGPNFKSVLKHDHLKNLAMWSITGDTPIPPLATLFGRRLAGNGEAVGIAPDPDHISCQRCETILQPGVNCTIRIEKASVKKQRRCKKAKSNVCLQQNNVVYYCSFCSHRNLKRGTAKDHLKEIYPTKPKPVPRQAKKVKELPVGVIASNLLSSPERTGTGTETDNVENISVVNTPKPMLTLERDKRIRKSKGKKLGEVESSSSIAVTEKTAGGSSSKRKRKSWTSIKEIAETNKSSRGGNLKIPFRL